MLPGPEQVVACPHCGGLAKYRTLRSGNTFGARVWTDGKQEAPMLPRPPAVVKCGECARCYWLAEAQRVGTLDLWGRDDDRADPAWEAAEDVEEPGAEDYYQAIEGGLAPDRARERTLRILAWWRSNDASRRGEPGGPAGAGSEAFRGNLEALAGLLDEGDENDLLMKAEALRELGRFDAALGLLGRVGSEDYAAVVGQLRALCERGEAGVRELGALS